MNLNDRLALITFDLKNFLPQPVEIDTTDLDALLAPERRARKQSYQKKHPDFDFSEIKTLVQFVQSRTTLLRPLYDQPQTCDAVEALLDNVQMLIYGAHLYETMRRQCKHPDAVEHYFTTMQTAIRGILVQEKEQTDRTKFHQHNVKQVLKELIPTLVSMKQTGMIEASPIKVTQTSASLYGQSDNRFETIDQAFQSRINDHAQKITDQIVDLCRQATMVLTPDLVSATAPPASPVKARPVAEIILTRADHIYAVSAEFPSVRMFHDALELKLTDLFLGCKSLASELVLHRRQTKGQVAHVMSIVPLSVPVLSQIVRTAAAVLEFEESVQLARLARLMSAIAPTLGDIEAVVREVTERITINLLDQLKRLSPDIQKIKAISSESETKPNIKALAKKVIKKSQEKCIELRNPLILAEAVLLQLLAYIADQASHDHTFLAKAHAPFEDRMTRLSSCIYLNNHLYSHLRYNRLTMAMVSLVCIDGTELSLEDVLQHAGMKVEQEPGVYTLYVHPKQSVPKAGYRLGTKEDAQRLNLNVSGSYQFDETPVRLTPTPTSPEQAQLEALTAQMAKMQAQLDQLTSPTPNPSLTFTNNTS